jgi:hypothetical protein
MKTEEKHREAADRTRGRGKEWERTWTEAETKPELLVAK